jgi:transposase
MYGGYMKYLLTFTTGINTLDDVVEIGKIIKENNLKMPNQTKLAKQLGVSRETIRKRLNGVTPKTTRDRNSKVSKHHDIILELLNHPTKEFAFKSELYNYIVHNYGDVDYARRTFNEYINKHFKEKFNQKKKLLVSPRFETNPGEQAQFDFKEGVRLVNDRNETVIVDIAVLTFGFSRKTFSAIIPDKSTLTVLLFLAQVFEEIGGVPKEILFDNAKCIASQPRTPDQEGIPTIKLQEFAKEYGFEIKLCIAGRPQTKEK